MQLSTHSSRLLVHSEVATHGARGRTNKSRLRWPAWLHPAALIYIGLSLATKSDYVGDSYHYADAILVRYLGQPPILSNPFWDFGHLLWRPLGWSLFRLFHSLLVHIVGPGLRLEVTVLFFAMNWLAGLGCAIVVFVLVERLTGRCALAAFITAAFLCVNSVLTFVHSGISYLAGLMFLLIAILLAVQAAQAGMFGKPRWRFGFETGAVLAASVCCWFPYVLVIPAVLAVPLLWEGNENRSLRKGIPALLLSCFFLALLTGLAYLAPVAALHLYGIAQFKGWMAVAGHGWNQTHNLTRLVFGLPRSFLHMGADGILFKRYLFHDPYAPVTLGDLFRLAAWKLVFFYLAALVLARELALSKEGLRILALLTIAFLPVALFAVLVFEAGSIERYLPLLPFVILGMAFLWRDAIVNRPGRAILAAFAVVMITVNLSALSRIAVNRWQQEQMARMTGIQNYVKRESWITTVTLNDGILQFNENPFQPLDPQGRLRANTVAEIATSQVRRWRSDFSSKTSAAWAAGGDMWISVRLLAWRPHPEWGWVEGDDPSIKWSDLPSYFTNLDLGEQVGGTDGFVRVLPDEHNRELISSQQ